MTSEIIVIRYNQPGLEQRCIESVQKHTDLKRHTLTVFDNYGMDWNLGALWNALIKRSKADYICLLNSDTEVEEGWLEKMLETASKADAVGPMTSKCGVPQQVGPRGKGVKSVRTLSGFCLLFPRQLWSDLKGFREDFTFYGQESNFLARVKNPRFFVRQDVFVKHVGGGSFKLSGRDMQEEHDLRLYCWYKNRDFNWSQRVAVIGAGKGNPFPLWRAVDQAGAEFERQGMAFTHIKIDDLEDLNSLLSFNPTVIIVAQSHMGRVARTEPWLNHFHCPKAVWVNDLRPPEELQAQQIEGMFDRVFLCWADNYKYNKKRDCSIQRWADQTQAEVNYMPQGSVINPKLEPLDVHRDLLFVGGMNKQFHAGRQEILDALKPEVFNSRVRAERIAIEEMTPKLCRESKFVLCQSPPAPGYNSLRLYNTLAYGGLALVHRFPWCEQLFTHGKHLLYFNDSHHASLVMRRNGDLEAIRKAGWRRQQAKHTVCQRIMNMVHVLTTGEYEFWGWL